MHEQGGLSDCQTDMTDGCPYADGRNIKIVSNYAELTRQKTPSYKQSIKSLSATGSLIAYIIEEFHCSSHRPVDA